MATVTYWCGPGRERHLAGRLLSASLHIPAIRKTLQSTASATLREAAELLDFALTTFGYRVREPLTTTDLAVALRALLLGFLDMSDLHEGELSGFPHSTFDWRGNPGWNTFAVASLGVVLEMTEEIDAPTGSASRRSK